MCEYTEIAAVTAHVGRFAVMARMSYLDVRFRTVLDRDLAWLAFFNTLPLLFYPAAMDALPPIYQIPGCGIPAWLSPLTVSAPLWLLQIISLAASARGALFLFLTSLILKCFSSKEYIGAGDILFVLAAGFGSSGRASLRMVLLAFVLAFPASLIMKAARSVRCADGGIAFIPFLSLASFLVRAFPEASVWSGFPF